MSYDNTCKYLVEKSPQSFVRWLLNIEPDNIEVLKTNLSTEQLQADSLILLKIEEQILQIEFQTLPYSNPPLPIRMLDYKARLVREYGRCRIIQVAIFLKSINSELVHENEYRDDSTVHRYRIIRLWEEQPDSLLANPALLPLAVLAFSDEPNALLQQVASQAAMIESTEQRQNILACTSVLAGLRFQKALIRTILREDLMEESVIYQDILQKGVQRGVQLGVQQGLQQGRKEELLSLLRRQLTRRIGVLEAPLYERLVPLTISQLEDLGEALLDFSEVSDLVAWLQAREG